MMDVAKTVALEFARKEINEMRGGKTSLLDSTFHPGNFCCMMCKMNYHGDCALNEHLSSKPHNEVS